MKKIINIDFQDEQHDYTAEVEVEFYFDSDYGSDADGNRGESRLFIDDINVIGIIDEEGRTVPVTKELTNLINVDPDKIID